jgi:uncharacterized protein (DUF58 family)
MPTARGWTVLAVGAALLAVGLTVGYPEFAALGGTGVLSVLVAAAWVGRPPGLTVERTFEPTRPRRGEPCRAVLDAHTVSRRTRAFVISDRVRGPAGDGSVVVPRLRVRGGLPSRVRYDVPTERRGPLTVGPLSVGRRDLLGLCRARQTVGTTAHLLVWPRWHPLRGLPAGVSPSLDGFADTARHGSIAFHSLREYRWGDDLRHVHWRTSARAGTLLVREYIDTALPHLVLLLDDRDSPHFEDAVEAAASILVAAGDAGLPVTLRLAGGAEAAASTGAGLDVLARAHPRDGVELDLAVRRLAPVIAGRTLVVVTGSETMVAFPGSADSRIVMVMLGGTRRVSVLPSGVTVLRAGSPAELALLWS